MIRTINNNGNGAVTSTNTAKKPAAKATNRRRTGPSSPAPSTRVSRKYDWELLKAQFVEGYPKDDDNPDGDRDWPNLRELSDRTNVPYERIRERAAKERWTALREAHQLELVKARKKKRIERLSTTAVEFDDKNLDLATLGIRLIGTRMREIAQEVGIRSKIRERAIQTLENGGSIDRSELWSAVRSTEMVELARAAETLQGIGMKALGTDIERHIIEHSVEGQIEHHHSVTEELTRDDPDRLAAFMAAASRAGVFAQIIQQNALEAGDADDTDEDTDDDDVVEAELVEEEPTDKPITINRLQDQPTTTATPQQVKKRRR